jgi:predicted GNAT family acetyltransferase
MPGEQWRVDVLDDPEEFTSRGGAWLVGHALDANVIGSVLAGTLAQPPGSRPATRWVLVLDGDGDVAGLAMQRPEYGLFLPDLPPGAAEAVAEELDRQGIDVTEVSGSLEAAHAFCRTWQRLTGTAYEAGTASRVYVLDALEAPDDVPGHRRTATASDLDLVIRWADAFNRETGTPGAGDDQRDALARRVAGEEVSLWVVDGAAVSMAAASPRVGGVARVNLVYTPPEQRGRGYGAAVAAAVSRRALDEGADTCMLFADLANPTSNGIYRRIGYRDLADSVVLRFS